MWGHLRFRARESQAPSRVGESLPSLVARARGMAGASVTLPPPLPLTSARALAAAASLPLHPHVSTVAPRAATRDRSRSPSSASPAASPTFGPRTAGRHRAGSPPGMDKRGGPPGCSGHPAAGHACTIVPACNGGQIAHHWPRSALLGFGPFPSYTSVYSRLGSHVKEGGGTVRRPPTSGCTRAKHNAAATPGWISTTAP